MVLGLETRLDPRLEGKTDERVKWVVLAVAYRMPRRGDQHMLIPRDHRQRHVVGEGHLGTASSGPIECGQGTMAVATNKVVGRLEGVLRRREVRELESRDEREESEEDRAHDGDEHLDSDRLGGVTMCK